MKVEVEIPRGKYCNEPVCSFWHEGFLSDDCTYPYKNKRWHQLRITRIESENEIRFLTYKHPDCPGGYDV